MNIDDIKQTLTNTKKASAKNRPENMEIDRQKIADDVAKFLSSGGSVKVIESPDFKMNKRIGVEE